MARAAPAPSPRPIPGVRNDMEVMESKAEPTFGSRAPRDGRSSRAIRARESDDRLIQFRREREKEIRRRDRFPANCRRRADHYVELNPEKLIDRA